MGRGRSFYGESRLHFHQAATDFGSASSFSLMPAIRFFSDCGSRGGAIPCVYPSSDGEGEAAFILNAIETLNSPLVGCPNMDSHA